MSNTIKQIQDAFQLLTAQGTSKNDAAELLAQEFGATAVRNALIQPKE